MGQPSFNTDYLKCFYFKSKFYLNSPQNLNYQTGKAVFLDFNNQSATLMRIEGQKQAANILTLAPESQPLVNHLSS